MLKNIDIDFIAHCMGWVLVNLITIYMIVYVYRLRRQSDREFGKGWRKKLKNHRY